MTVMIAIHVIRRCGGSFVVMMCRNLALSGRAAGGLIGRPCGAREGRVKQNDRQQANACSDRTATILTHTLHVARGPVPTLGHYIVTRHSLQAE